MNLRFNIEILQIREYYTVELSETIDEFDYGCPPVPTWMVYQGGMTIGLEIALCKSKRISQILVNALTAEEEKINSDKKYKSFKQKLTQRLWTESP